jgi:hypothetical protein
MKKHYRTGRVCIDGNNVREMRTIPLNASWKVFDAETAAEVLGDAVRLTLTGLKVRRLLSADGGESEVVFVDLSGVKEFVDGHPVFDFQVIYEGWEGPEVGIEIVTPNGRTIRVFSSARDAYIVQAVGHEFVITETEGVPGSRLGETVMRLAKMTAIEL